jgi:hypothetical protein
VKVLSPKLKVAVATELSSLGIDVLNPSAILMGDKVVKVRAGTSLQVRIEGKLLKKKKVFVVAESADIERMKGRLRDLEFRIIEVERFYPQGNLTIKRSMLILKSLDREKIRSLDLYPREVSGKPRSWRRALLKLKDRTLTFLGEFKLEGGPFLLRGVPVGKGFHWEHREDLLFDGPLIFYPNEEGLTVVQEISLEDYLSSVVVSEMPKEAPLEALKAQAIAARGTALIHSLTHHPFEPFDICSTDHCQVYKGQGRVTDQSKEATNETCGEVLFYGEDLADPRFATVCGGISEEFQNVWGGAEKAYLKSKADILEGGKLHPIMDEKGAQDFINSDPPVACNPRYGQGLNFLDYAWRLFRWEIRYKTGELREIILRKTGHDLGQIKGL